MRNRIWAGLIFCLCLSTGAAGAARANGDLPRPVSVPMAQDLPAQPAAPPASPATPPARFVTAAGGTWTNVTAPPKSASFFSPVLLTDGSVVVQSVNTKSMWKLTPDKKGNYAQGTWHALPSLPVIGGTQYAPLYRASAVLPDGRLILMGGEYNGSSTGVWTNLGAIYDPIANAWTPVAAPAGQSWTRIGDAASVILPDGTFMLSSCCAKPAATALLNPQTLGWTSTGAPRYGASYQDEQGYTLLPDGDVLTVDVWTKTATGAGPTNSELYVPATGKWIKGPTLPVSVVDQRVCKTDEIGPAILRGDGTLVQFGANTGCAKGGSPIDPTAILDTTAMSWSQGPSLPAVCGSAGTTACTTADAPAADMPNNTILFAASAGYGLKPSHFFELSPDNVITQVSDPLENSTSRGAYTYSLLDLPNGQVLMADQSGQMEVYTPAGPQVDADAPIVTSAPVVVQPGGTYTIAGSQLGGLTQGAAYGDDAQMATNFPIIAITNTATGHVAYARSLNFSLYAVGPNSPSQATFTVPAAIETGAATLAVIANGVASAPLAITVE